MTVFGGGALTFKNIACEYMSTFESWRKESGVSGLSFPQCNTSRALMPVNNYDRIKSGFSGGVPLGNERCLNHRVLLKVPGKKRVADGRNWVPVVVVSHNLKYGVSCLFGNLLCSCIKTLWYFALCSNFFTPYALPRFSYGLWYIYIELFSQILRQLGPFLRSVFP